MRSVLIVIFVFFYLLLGLPVLGAMWIIHKFARMGRYGTASPGTVGFRVIIS